MYKIALLVLGSIFIWIPPGYCQVEPNPASPGETVSVTFVVFHSNCGPEVVHQDVTVTGNQVHLYYEVDFYGTISCPTLMYGTMDLDTFEPGDYELTISGTYLPNGSSLGPYDFDFSVVGEPVPEAIPAMKWIGILILVFVLTAMAWVAIARHGPELIV